MTIEPRELWLLVRVGAQLCALPLEHVEETMRPLPVRPIPGVPTFVDGLAVIRGLPVPVVDAAAVLGDHRPSTRATRIVALKTGDRRVALAVDEVLGVRQIHPRQLSGLPPLLAAAREHVVSAVGILDHELLLVLRSGRLVPEAVWSAMAAGEIQ